MHMINSRSGASASHESYAVVNDQTSAEETHRDACAQHVRFIKNATSHSPHEAHGMLSRSWNVVKVMDCSAGMK